MPTTTATRPAASARRWGSVLFGLAALALTGGVHVVDATTPEGASAYLPISPCRLADTRPAPFNVGERAAPLGADEALTLTGRGDRGECGGPNALPVDATGLQLNVTAVNATRATYLTLHPTGVAPPNASHLNPVPGDPPAPNSVAVKLDAQGRFDVFNKFGTVDVIVDVVGIYTDHRHDDRYYTKAQVDALLADPGEPWELMVQLGAITMQTDQPDIQNSKQLPGNAKVGMEVGFQLPADYRAGRDLIVETVLRLNAINPCAIRFVADNPASRTRPSEHHQDTTPVAFEANAATEYDFPVPEAGAYTVGLRISGADLQPGDWVTVEFARDGAAGSDTCPNAVLHGMIVGEA